MKYDINYVDKNASKENKITPPKIKNMFDILREGIEICVEIIKEGIIKDEIL